MSETEVSMVGDRWRVHDALWTRVEPLLPPERLRSHLASVFVHKWV